MYILKFKYLNNLYFLWNVYELLQSFIFSQNKDLRHKHR